MPRLPKVTYPNKGPKLQRLDDAIFKLTKYKEYKVLLDTIGFAFDFNELLILCRSYAHALDVQDKNKELKDA